MVLFVLSIINVRNFNYPHEDGFVKAVRPAARPAVSDKFDTNIIFSSVLRGKNSS